MGALFRLRVVLVFGATLVAIACSGGTVKKPPAKRCTEFGQQCEVSPGKLGACVVRHGCTGDDCLVCQSQH